MNAAVNERVRVGRGLGGTVVVLGAWCSVCAQEAMPSASGHCLWCGSLIVDESSLSVRRMLALPEREPAAASPVAESSVDAQAPSRSESAKPKRGRKVGRPKQWTRRKIIASLQAFHAQYGRIPTNTDIRLALGELPTWNANKREFGSLADALEAAGLERPKMGRPRSKASGGVRVPIPNRPAPPEDIVARLGLLIVEAQAIQAAMLAASVAA